MPETVPLEHTPLDSGVDTADLSSIETLHSSRMRGARRVSRSPRYLESVHGPSVHSAPSSQSWSAKQERDNYSFPIRAASEQPSELFTSSRSSLHKEKALTSPDQLASKHIDSPFDLFITAGKISFMLHEDVHHSSETEHMPNVQRPLIYVLVTHPHMFYSQYSRNCSIQVSVYNALVSLGSPRTIPEYQPSFSETDFPVVLFESSKGNPDPKTGVLPCLLQTQWTLTPSKPAQMSIDLARPAKFIASAVNLEFTHYILNVISACFTHAAKADSNSVEPEQSTKSLEQLHEKFSRIGAVNFNSVQIIVALEVENEDHITSVLELSVASLCGDLMCTSRTRWGCNVSVVERIVCHLNSNGLCLAASHSLSRQLLLQPCNVEFRLELLWPSWLPRSLIHSLPHTQLTIQSEYVALVVSPDIIKSLTSVCKAYKPYLTRNVVDGNRADIASTQYKSPSTPGSEVQSNETDSVDTEQPYTDDLRAGAFQFMDATNTMERDQIPLPYQCVFWESSPPAIAWRYPQPRSLTNVHIFPVPFKSAPDAEVGREDAPVVVCSLQYWSECQGAYQHYATFLLSETNESKVVLPTTPSTAVSAVWRVLLAGTRDLHEHGLSVPNSDTSDLPATEVPVVSPRALAACMRVDSFFSASLAPNFQACFNMTVIQVSLMNQLSDSQGHAMPPKLQEYLIDGKVPHDHCFLWLSLNHLALFYSTWPEGRKIAELNSLAQLEILDYASLSQQTIIEPFLSSTCITLSGNDAIDVSVVSRPIAIRIGPSVTHTIAASTNLWLQELGPKITKPTQVLISQYVLCNDTVLPIVVGQAETDEQILLPSRQCHMYSWRSLSKKPVLHLTIMDPSIHQFGKSAWSSHFTIDSLGVHVCKINIPTNREVILFAHVTALSATQKQVTVTGQLQVLNQTDQLLDLRIMRSSSDWSMEACNCLVPLQSTGVTPSLLLDRHADDPQLAIRLRLRQVDASLWTGDIPLKENPKSHQPWLVKVPLQDKQQFICVWCRVIREYVKGERKILVMLSPLYAVRSFLPTSVPATILNDQSEQAKVSLEVKGQGEATLLHLPGALKESTHQLHLRSAANMKIFPFSYSCIDPKKIFTSGDQANIKSVLEASSESKMLTWPLPSSELSSIKWIGIEIDNSYVQAHFSPLSQYSGTMLLELRPWALLLNMLEGNLCIEQSGETVFSMPSRGVVAPPKLEGTFHLGLKFCDSEEWFFSEALQLARPDWGKSFYMPRISGLVPVEGHVQIAVQCGPAAVSLLTLRSQVHCDIRVVSTCSSFIVSNSSSVPLQVTAVAVRHTDLNSQLTVPKKNLPEVMYATRNVPPDRNHKGFPLEKWMHLKSCDVDIVPYMFVSVEDSSHFSCPLRISGFPPRKRFTVPVSHEKGCESSYPAFRSFVLSVVESNGQTFVNIADEPYPQMILHNGCDFRILCAEVSPVGKANNAEFKVIPDASPWDWYCSVDPYCDVGYSAHSVDNVFPQITSTPPNFFIALAVDTGDTKSGHTLLWSPAVQLSGKQEQFISIPGRGDVKVHSWVEGYSTHLSIEAVSRVEICARDIRSRLSAVPEYPVELLDNPDPSPEVLFTPIMEDSDLMKYQEEKADIVHRSPCMNKKQSSLKLTIFVQSCSLIVTAPVSVFEEIEVSALTLDHITVSLSPIAPSSSQTCPPELSLQVTLGDFQLDNQLYEYGGFDFPVVLMGQHNNDVSKGKFSFPVNLNSSASHFANKFSPQALLAVNIILESNENGLTPKTVHISTGPITVYIEDKYVMDLKKHAFSLLSPFLALSVLNDHPEHSKNSSASAAWISPPLPVCLELQVLKRPLRLTSLTLDPVWLLLSVHSSMRVYIALDRSPLQFTQFCRRSLFTTSYNLGHTLSMHYLSGAIFGAGWVVSSLELLGSPGGFARTLGTGLRDFVSLPYHGILEGPWGFLVGVTHGSASLMKHFTAGTLTSVTKMASSVARNLDRLTLDAEHLERAEELRRMRPQGVAEGLMQGLTGLGISILGAVGGLAHHPLQSVLSGQPSPRGVVTGVGRGLVGVFTKPLSGAADLVAMTGQGLLQGAGWSNLPQLRQQTKVEKEKIQRSALIKYSSKIQHPNAIQCLLVIEATLETSPSCFKAVTLMLTTQSVIILSADGDNVESQLPLMDIILPENDDDPTLLTITFRGAPPVVDQRMWDFVNGCRYVVNTGPPALEASEDVRPVSPVPLSSTLPLTMQTAEHLSAPEVEDGNPNLNLNLSRCSSDDGGVSLGAVQPAETTASSKAKPPVVFHVNPQVRSHFLILLRVAQRQLQGQGFQIL